MIEGALIVHRFEILAEATSGGMSTVFRARDLHTGDIVALKLVSPSTTTRSEVERFSREARLLAELRHPGIVSYIAHGETPDGTLYLAMEWLDGEDLASRLSRGPLSLRDSLALLRATADALSLAHRNGIIHRDLKPSNLFLREGVVDRVTLLDFGVARRRQVTREMTRTGSLIGTPEYMAPEQARGERTLSAATDVFALSSVIYECLSGRPPFVADHIAAQLAKVLFEDPTPIRELRPDVPEALEALLFRMLTKDAAQRPKDAGVVYAEVCELLAQEDLGRREPKSSDAAPVPNRLTVHEQELVSVILASRKEAPLKDSPSQDGEQTRLSEELLRFGMETVWLSDGSLLTTLSKAGNATDQAAQAARAALMLVENFSEAVVAMATGRGVIRGRLPVGEVVDRAARLIAECEKTADGQNESMVILDEVSAALLDARFVIEPLPIQAKECWRLFAERSSADATRTLLGKPTPCVGREPELGMLEALLIGCREEATAGAVLIKAQQGFGKSRLWHEFVRRLRSRQEDLEIWSGRGEAMSAGSPFGILTNVLLGLCGIVRGEPLESQRQKLEERIGKNVDAGNKRRVVELVGELCGVPFPDEDSALLREARRDPKVMNRATATAFLDLLRAECKKRPVLIGLDDLQWGDELSVSLISTALRELSEQPLLLVMLGRLEVTTIFPQLWVDRLQEITLSGLSRKASERLVEEVLGKRVAAAVSTRIVAHAGGNALYLEELIRAEASGRGGKLPESILAMLQSRLSHLEPGARLLLRAASVFGETFWRGGVQALLRGRGKRRGDSSATAQVTQIEELADNPADSHPDSEIDGWLAILSDAEIVERHASSRIAFDIEYSFRHGLLREAAYGLLTPADEKLGHRLACAFLEEANRVQAEPGRPSVIDPFVLGEHCERGGDLLRAPLFYLRAAEQTLSGNDLRGALKRAERGVACIRAMADDAKSETVELLGSLRCLQALVHFWLGEWGPANARAREAMSLVPNGNFLFTHPLRASFYMLFGRPAQKSPST